MLHNTPAELGRSGPVNWDAKPRCVRRTEKGIIPLLGHNGVAIRFRITIGSAPNHGRINCPMKPLQHAMLCVIGVMSVMALYLAVRSHSERLADVAALLDTIETRLADRENLDAMHASIARDIDSQGVIRSADGNVIGHWGIDEPLSFRKITY